MDGRKPCGMNGMHGLAAEDSRACGASNAIRYVHCRSIMLGFQRLEELPLQAIRAIIMGG